MTSHNEQDMDANRLASITADAVSNVLYFHTNQITPPANIRHAGLELAIDAVFHLRSRAADIGVAHLEIACDAALSYANDYNELNPDNIVNPRWMYMCVQALLSQQLSPALVEGTKVQRLNDWVTTQQNDLKVEKQKQRQRRSSSDPSEPADDGPTLSSIGAPTTPSHGSMDIDVTVASDEGDDDLDDHDDEDEGESGQVLHRRHGIIRPTPKRPWTDEDISFLIELRAMGMTHKQTADYLNRGQGAVENKYGRVVRETAWKPYVAECTARYTEMRQGKGKHQRLPPSDQHYTDEQYEEDYDFEAMRRRRVKRQRTVTLAAAEAAAATTMALE